MDSRFSNSFQLEALEPRLLLAAEPLAGFVSDYVSGSDIAQAIEESVDIGKQGLPASGEIRGMVWFDSNQDGIFDQGEAGVGDWEVFLDSDGDGQLDVTESTQSFESTDVDKPFGMPASTLIQSTLTVSAPAAKLTDVNLKVSVTHPDLFNMNINLTAPDGTTAVFDLLGYSLTGENMVDTVLDDEAATLPVFSPR